MKSPDSFQKPEFWEVQGGEMRSERIDLKQLPHIHVCVYTQKYMLSLYIKMHHSTWLKCQFLCI